MTSYQQYQLEKITRDIMEENYFKTPREINAGLCDEWAQRAIEKLGKHAHMHVTPTAYKYIWAGGHYWIKYQGKHYDAEALQGVNDWKDLPFFKRCLERRNLQTTR
jgi:hypothetical protein